MKPEDILFTPIQCLAILGCAIALLLWSPLVIYYLIKDASIQQGEVYAG